MSGCIGPDWWASGAPGKLSARLLSFLGVLLGFPGTWQLWATTFDASSGFAARLLDFLGVLLGFSGYPWIRFCSTRTSKSPAAVSAANFDGLLGVSCVLLGFPCVILCCFGCLKCCFCCFPIMKLPAPVIPRCTHHRNPSNTSSCSCMRKGLICVFYHHETSLFDFVFEGLLGFSVVVFFGFHGFPTSKPPFSDVPCPGSGIPRLFPGGHYSDLGVMQAPE